MNIKLSDHFTYKRLLRFVLPSIVMMIFTSIYGVVDGFFVSNYAGKTEFAAVNLIIPFPMLLGAFGFMIGTGGSAVVSMKLGQGKKEEANRIIAHAQTEAVQAEIAARAGNHPRYGARPHNAGNRGA
jgi:Na+-driven multidrug efflux pump